MSYYDYEYEITVHDFPKGGEHYTFEGGFKEEHRTAMMVFLKDLVGGLREKDWNITGTVSSKSLTDL